MKRIIKMTALMLVMAFSFAMIAPTVMAASYGYVKTATAGSSVNIRKSASTSSAKVTSVKDGTKVELLATSGDWYKIKVNGKTGYIKKSYITTSSSSSSSTSSSSSSAKTGTAKQSAYVYKTAKASSSNRLTTVKKGATFEVLSSTTNFYKIKVDGKTGYILKKYVTVSSSSSSSSSTATSTVGEAIGVYTTSSITKPADVVTGKEKVFNAINWNLTQMNNTFTVKVKNFAMANLPTSISDLERYFVATLTPEIGEADSSGVTTVTFKVEYNEAGRVVQDLLHGKSLTSSETRAAKVKEAAQKYLSAIEGKSDYQKIVYIHDNVVKNASYDTKMSDDSYTVYGVLCEGIGSCQGYAETLQMLFTLAGIENRMVWAKSKMSEAGTHGFNKVKLDGKWYNVDATVDDPYPDASGRIRRDYLLVTDSVSKQRYSWDTTRYPASSTKNNWHQRNKLVATSQSSLETLVKAGVKNKEKFISVWVDDYSSSKYTTAFAKKLSGVSDVKVTITGAASSYKTFGTAILFQVTYK